MFLAKSDTLAPDHGCEILVGMTVAQGVAGSSLHFLMLFFQNQLSSSINPFVYGCISCPPDIRHDIYFLWFQAFFGTISFEIAGSDFNVLDLQVIPNDMNWSCFSIIHRNSPEPTGTHWKPLVIFYVSFSERTFDMKLTEISKKYIFLYICVYICIFYRKT